jgi:hypothetical protein
MGSDVTVNEVAQIDPAKAAGFADMELFLLETATVCCIMILERELLVFSR